VMGNRVQKRPAVLYGVNEMTTVSKHTIFGPFVSLGLKEA